MKDHDTFGSQDPYCVITVGSTKKQTKAHSGGGKNPVWSGYTWTFPKQGSQDIKVEVFDDDAGADDKIGSGLIRMRDITTRDQVLQVPLRLKNKDAGYVNIRVRFQPQQYGQSSQRP